MGYFNMIFQYGESNFLNKCKSSGVNGLIVVDLPWPENKDFAKKCKPDSYFFSGTYFFTKIIFYNSYYFFSRIIPSLRNTLLK